MSKYIIVPSPVIMKRVDGSHYTEADSADPNNPQKNRELSPVTLLMHFVKWVIEVRIPGTNVSKMGVGYDARKRIKKLIQLLEANQEPYSVISLDQDDYDLAVSAVKTVDFIPTHFGLMLEPIEDAWVRSYDSREDAEAAAAKLKGALSPAT